MMLHECWTSLLSLMMKLVLYCLDVFVVDDANELLMVNADVHDVRE